MRGLDNLYVADGSLFPHSVRVNPMLSIMATADIAVRSIGDITPAEHILEGPAHAYRQKRMATKGSEA